MQCLGRLFASSHGRTSTFRVVGPATMLESVPLRDAAAVRLEEGATTIVVDLAECTWMDSTFLGTLLVLARQAERGGRGARVLLGSPSLECQRVIEQTGVAEILAAVVSQPTEGQVWTELHGASDDTDALRRNVLRANEQLARLGGAAGDEFREVARALAEDQRKFPAH
jgi:anti-anti-sigma factor